MAVSDSSPERRNLILTSMAFITFYAAGGELTDQNLKLFFISIHFTRPEVLAVLSWATLIWFGMRFYQKHAFAYWENLVDEIGEVPVPKKLANYAINQIKKEIEETNSDVLNGKTIFVSHPFLDGNQLYMVCSLKNHRNSTVMDRSIEIKGLRKLLFISFSAFRLAVTRNAFAEFIVPYLLFLIAISGPGWKVFL